MPTQTPIPPRPARRWVQWVLFAAIIALVAILLSPPFHKSPKELAQQEAVAAEADYQEIQPRVQDALVNGKAAELVDEIRRLAHRHPGHYLTLTLAGQVFVDAAGHPAYDLTLEDQARVDRALLKEAYDVFCKSLAIHADQPTVEAAAATIAYQLDIPDQSINHCLKAIALDNDAAEYHRLLAQNYIRQRDWARASHQLAIAVGLDGENEVSFKMLSDIERENGRYPAAKAFLENALDKSSPRERDYRLRQVFYTREMAKLVGLMDGPENAILVLRGLHPEEQTIPGVVEDIASYYGKLGRLQKAAAEWDGVMLLLKMDAKTPDPRLYAGAVRWNLTAGNIDKAQNYLATLKQLSPNFMELPALEAMFRQTLGQTTLPAP